MGLLVLALVHAVVGCDLKIVGGEHGGFVITDKLVFKTLVLLRKGYLDISLPRLPLRETMTPLEKSQEKKATGVTYIRETLPRKCGCSSRDTLPELHRLVNQKDLLVVN